MSTFDPLPGFREFYPEDCALRNYIFNMWRGVCRRHNFVEYAVPTLQPTELFVEKSGPEIVGQLFNFADKGGREVTLPPEATPYVAHMVGAKASALKRPLRWFSIPQCFRYERPQKGRGREFYQLNADIFDEAGITAEVEILALTIDIFRSFGLTKDDFAVRISDRTLWLEYLAATGMTAEQSMNVLQIVDKWEKEEPAEIKKKLEAIKTGSFEKIGAMINIKSIDALEKILSEMNAEKLLERLNEWKALIADLNAMGLKDFVQVDLGIVRGLAYYTGFVFEVFEKNGGRALAGGGRYDNLIEKVGGPKMAAFGMGLGDITLLNLLTEKKLLPNLTTSCDFYIAYMGDAARAKALEILPQLRDAGFSVEISLKSLNFGKHLKAADKAGARVAIIIGDDELNKGIAKLKSLSSGKETEAPLEKLVEYLRSAE